MTTTLGLVNVSARSLYQRYVIKKKIIPTICNETFFAGKDVHFVATLYFLKIIFLVVNQ
jgi:hypothetical protein